MPGPFVYASPEQVTKDKADYARRNIARGRPIVVLEYADGVLLLAENPSTLLHKVSEIYDRIAFAGVGKYDEYERLRIHGIRQADLKGYEFSREDVTARSLANLYSQTLGTIFTEAPKPFEVDILLAQVGEAGSPNEIYRITFDGVITDEQGCVALGGQTEDLATALKQSYEENLPLDRAIRVGVDALSQVGTAPLPTDQLEAAILDRNVARRRFVRLTDAQIDQART